jgi:N-methylhydantoinase A
VILKTLNPTHLLGGLMPIDRARAEAAIARLAKQLGLDVTATAQGIVSVVTANMAKAIRVISVQRGHDPREYTLVAFGGAGPLHAARLARELEIPRVLVPRHPGILCALGLLLSDLKTNYAQTRLTLLTPDAVPQMLETFAALEARADAWFDREDIAPTARTLRRTIDMRYAGQNYELPVPWPEAPSAAALVKQLTAGFERAHEQMYGYIAVEEPVQAVTFRLEAVGAVLHAEVRAEPPATTDVSAAIIGQREVWLAEAAAFVSCPIYDRERLGPGHELQGPAIVEQMDATTLLLPEQRARVDEFTNLVIDDER